MFVRVRFRKYFLYVSLILHSSLVCELDFSIISSVRCITHPCLACEFDFAFISFV